MADPAVELRVLRSPFAVHEGITYSMALTDDERQEIVETIRILKTESKEMYFVLAQKFKNGVPENWTDKSNVDEFFTTFNSLADSFRTMWQQSGKPPKMREHKGVDYLKQILTNLAYRRAIPDPNVLNKHYSAFSSQTYGETTYNRMASIINELHIDENDILVDLGSGVGNVVLQMSAASRLKKCVGIEIAGTPAHAAQRLSEEFTKWMRWFGRKWRPFELFNDDFLKNEYKDLITKEATILFINNYAFSADLECKIKLLLGELSDGTRVVSTRPYASVNSNVRITKRRLESAGADLTAVFDVIELPHVPQSTSWTCNTVAYYLHTVNASKIERYFEAAHSRSNPSSADSNSPLEAGSPSSQKYAGTSRGSSVQPSALLQRAIVQARLEDQDAVARHRLTLKEKKHKRHRSKDTEKEKSAAKLPRMHRQTSEVVRGRSSTPSSLSTSRESSVSRANQKAIKAAQCEQGGSGQAADGSFYGPTTRRQWNAWVENKTFGGPVKKEKKVKGAEGRPKHKETSATTDEAGSTDGRDTPPPTTVARKRTSSGAKRSKSPVPKAKLKLAGRPPKEEKVKPLKLKSHSRQTSLDDLKQPATVASALQHLHDMTQMSNPCTSPGVHVSALPRAQSIENDSKPMAPITAVDKQAAEMLTPGLLQQTQPASHTDDVETQMKMMSKYPALNTMMGKMLRMYTSVIDRYSTDAFRHELELEIATARARHATLETNKARLVEQIDRLLNEGCGKLTDRLMELNIVARAPMDLMAQSKEIVLQHQELRGKLRDAAQGVNEATAKNRELLAMLKDRDEQYVASGALRQIGLHPSDTVENSKSSILLQMEREFSTRRQARSEHSRVSKEVAQLQASLTSLPTSLVMQASNEVNAAGYQTSDTPMAPLPATVPKRVRAPRNKAASTRKKKEPTVVAPPPTAPVVANLAAFQTPPAVVVPMSQAPQVQQQVQQKQLETVEKQGEPAPADDIDQQVQSFVSVALKVDERAKREEKERRQRSDQRRNRKPQATLPSTATPPTTVAQHPTFIGSGLVPVYNEDSATPPQTDQPIVSQQQSQYLAAPEEPMRQRQRSGESTETESAPSTPKPEEEKKGDLSNDEEQGELRIDDEPADLTMTEQTAGETATPEAAQPDATTGAPQ